MKIETMSEFNSLKLLRNASLRRPDPAIQENTFELLYVPKITHMDPCVCRVCGLRYNDFYPWGPDGQIPSHDICDCCGSEFGYEDVTVESSKVNRNRWIEKGAAWFQPEKKPS